ncbi:YgaP family membrane protein [Undibacterium sp. Xuan67W]|uniref:YgaP family membrane protein n=1 Tax=Undibacterium sp. Xuan67W TaxID=3413057 RepID=UPI003BF254BF
MKINVGSTDRWIRIIAGLGLIVASLTGFIGMWGWLGIVPVLTGTFRFCPAYLPFGLSTCSIKK